MKAFKPKLQTGGNVPKYLTPNKKLFRTSVSDFINPNEETLKQYNPDNAVRRFHIEYVDSPKYRERLEKMGYRNIDDVIRNRRKRLQEVQILPQTEEGIGSAYSSSDNKIFMDNKQASEIGTTRDDILAHELGHVNNSSVNVILDPNYNVIEGISNTSLNEQEERYIGERNKNVGIGKFSVAESNARKYNKTISHILSEVDHEYSPYENKSDIDSFRYILKQEGIYDAGTQDFTPEMLERAKKNKNIKKLYNPKRLFENFSDEDLIDIMNNVAKNDRENLPIAKYGLKIMNNFKPKYQLGGLAWDNPEEILPFNSEQYPIYNTDPNTQQLPITSAIPPGAFPDRRGIDAFSREPWVQRMRDRYQRAGFSEDINFDNNTLRFTRGTGIMQDSPYVKGFNLLASGVTGIANWMSNNRLKNEEQRQVNASLQPRYWENMERYGLNNIPAYTKYGGRGTEEDWMFQGMAHYGYPYGDISAYNSYSTSQPVSKYRAGGGPSAAKAREILHDGTIHGKPITDRQRKYFGAIVSAAKKAKKQTGGTTATTPVDIPTPEGYAPLTQQQRQDWNRFVQYLNRDVKIGGSKELDERTNATGLNYLKQYAKDNPGFSVTPEMVPYVQYEFQQLKQNQSLPGVNPEGRVRKLINDYFTDRTISDVDGWIGSLTSRQGYPIVTEFSDDPERRFWNLDYEGASQYEKDVWNKMEQARDARRQRTGASFQAGGAIPEIYGLPTELEAYANVEAEEGEVFESVDGTYNKIADDAGTHEEGGVKLANVSRVLEDTSDKRKDKNSKLLKMSPDEIEAMFGFKPKRPMSHASAFEYLTEQYDKERKKYTDAMERIGDRTFLDKYMVNSAKLDFQNLQAVPDNDEIFDALYDHQEAIKDAAGIRDDGGNRAKIGGKYKYQAGGTPFDPYSGGRTAQGRTTPAGNPNAFAFQGGLPALIKAWQDAGFDMTGISTPGQFQERTYDKLLSTPEGRTVLRAMWDQGNTARGIQQNILTDRFPQGNFRGADLTDADLATLRPAYVDNLLGVRTITPAVTTETPPAINITPTLPPTPNVPNTGVTINPPFIDQPRSRFNEPTYWDELAPGVLSLVDSLTRDPELYNPMEFNQLRYRLMDPTVAMSANQSDFNAAQQVLDNATEGVGAGVALSNLANLNAAKYRANNQIMGQYDNQNTQIKNQEILYNTQVRDRQAVADAQSRGQYYRNVQLSRENQRQQRLKAIEDLGRVAQLKRRQNRSGNLILQMTPAFDQYGEYNGYQYVPVINPALGISKPPTPISTKKTSSNGGTKTTTTWKLGDRTIRTTETAPTR